MSCIPNPLRYNIVQNVMNHSEQFKNFLDWYHSPPESWREAMVPLTAPYQKWQEQPHQYQCENQTDWSVFLLAGFKVMSTGGEEDWNPNAAGQLEKYQFNLDADILPTNETDKSSGLS